MKLLLKEPVAKLGTIGDIVDVADGFGRNYLLPQGIAVPVTEGNIRLLERKKQELLEKERQRKEGFEALKTRLEAETVTIPMQAGGEGKLYGSVTPVIIADAFQKLGIDFEAKWLLLDEPLRELGVYDVRARLHPEVMATVKVWVVEARPEEKAPTATA